MSYANIDDDNFLEDILRRKEFYSLKANPAWNFRDPPESDGDPFLGKYLKAHSHQLFVRNYMNPNTKFKRLHLSHNMGTGKTLGAVLIAQECIPIYQKIYTANTIKLPPGRRNYTELDRSTPSVFVLGFGGTKSAFIRELLRYPNFGFVSLTEKDELEKRRKIADAGLPDDVKNYKEYYTMLKKRITNKSKGGFYKFFGYDEFVNKLFISENIKLTDLEAIAIQKLRDGENITLEDIFYKHIQEGKIQVNQQLLAMFENSLLICDEIHHTYNMNMKNNRGVAIQFILDSVPSVRLLSISATPINNSPTEVVELVNYLVPPEAKITKRGFFANSRTLLPGKLEELGRLSRGRISFLQDINLKYFPKKIFLGDPIKLPKDVDIFAAGSEIPYLKFISCPMSQFHQATYTSYMKSVQQNTEIVAVDDEAETEDVNEGPTTQYSYHSIPTDGYSIYDIVFPSPDSADIGIFRSGEVRNKISLAPQEWRDKTKILMKKFSAINNIISGDFLRRENIGKYSTKCATLLDILGEIIRRAAGDPKKCQKIMIYHDRVKMSGVLLLQELLRMNSFIDEYSEPAETTLCCVCGAALSQHSGGGLAADIAPHDYRPVRFIMAHSDMEKAIMDQSLAKFNSPDNAMGHNFMILVGSRIIRESYDFKDIQNLIVFSLPINIPTLLQVLGRCIRKHSHINLPPAMRRVFIRILITTVNDQFEHLDNISPEIYRYIDKLADYIAIQKIEREFNRNAIDADIHRDIIMPPELRREYFPRADAAEPINILGNLYFEPSYTIPKYTAETVKTITFNAYRHYEEEIHMISYIIKRLFIMNPVWSYDDLWAAVRRPPVGIEMNPELFDENNFIIALNNLVVGATTVISAAKKENEMTESMLVERLFDQNERHIYLNGGRYKIEQVDKYYILFPVEQLPTNPLNLLYAEYTEHVRDKERAMIKELVEPNERVSVDVETYLRRMIRPNGIKINIDLFVKESKANVNYAAKKEYFIAKYGKLDDITQFLIEFSAQFQMSFAEEAITFVMLGPESRPKSESEVVFDLYRKVIRLLDSFKVIIYMQEIIKYKDTARQYKNGLPALPNDTPLGYITSKSIRLFDPQLSPNSPITEDSVDGGRWIEASKIALNRHITYKENEIIIGYLEPVGDQIKFKLRKPIHKIKEDIGHIRRESKSETASRERVSDTRLIERGIVCTTKNKKDLLSIIASLGISASRLDRSEIRIRKLCEIIKNKLIENEIKERQRDSRYKYLYCWWDEVINLSSVI